MPGSMSFPAFPQDLPKRSERPPRALAEHVMAQVEHSGNLDRWGNAAYRLVTLIHCGLRVSDALRLERDCIACDADGAPYLRYSAGLSRLYFPMYKGAVCPVPHHHHPR